MSDMAEPDPAGDQVATPGPGLVETAKVTTGRQSAHQRTRKSVTRASCEGDHSTNTTLAPQPRKYLILLKD
ncbi:hypothetical protein NX059_012260 [Plenodomus lindquistii]|nr:hypothetical protein NX059_012260 [Plenodomus lindquistii]